MRKSRWFLGLVAVAATALLIGTALANPCAVNNGGVTVTASHDGNGNVTIAVTGTGSVITKVERRTYLPPSGPPSAWVDVTRFDGNPDDDEYHFYDTELGSPGRTRVIQYWVTYTSGNPPTQHEVMFTIGLDGQISGVGVS